MEYLISNSGIQFVTREVEFSPDQPLMLADGRPLRMQMYEEYDPFMQRTEFDFLVIDDSGAAIPLNLLANQINIQMLKKGPDGALQLDAAGLPIITPGANTTLMKNVVPGEDVNVYTFPTLNAFQVQKGPDSFERVPAFELLLDHWIPVPLFEQHYGGQTEPYPTGWCRVMINLIEKGKNTSRYRITYAIDTATTDDPLSVLQPYFSKNAQGEHTERTKDFTLCNSASDMLSSFLFTQATNANGEVVSTPSDESNYFAQLLNQKIMSEDDSQESIERFKHIGYYAFFITMLRHICPIQVQLCNSERKGLKPIDVDLVLDIGNSRTCGILFENSDFSRRGMLCLRDMRHPWVTYDSSFDMRVVFRMADFGNDISIKGGENLFKWRSLLRVGNEAIDLMYRSLEDEGMSRVCSSYSSPKRYLWDVNPFDDSWDFHKTEDDPLSIRALNKIYMDRMTSYMREDGTVADKPQISRSSECHYSRSSLMMLVFVELFRQAEAQINSAEFRNANGDWDVPRRLRNIIITAPTAMSNAEQVRLRQHAVDAFNLMCRDGIKRPPIQVIPTPDSIVTRPVWADPSVRNWTFDEATACQLVYLFAEVQKKYDGDFKSFFSLRGKPRPDMEQLGYEGPVLTVGSIDIGAGTTDLMICSYADGGARITPVPLFWDSFYLAGDDILRNIVQYLIIEGENRGDDYLGSISSVLMSRMRHLTDEQFAARKEKSTSLPYRADIENILCAVNKDEREKAIESYCHDLLIDYFGINTGNNDFVGRRCRVDFNTQISLPIARRYMQLLSEERPQRNLSFDEMFADNRPADYVLRHFEHHFGFPLEEIIWEYNPEKVEGEIRKTMTSLMEQLALILHAYKVDIVLLAGRPTRLSAITDLFLKFYPVSPDRLVRLPKYMVGNWYPFAYGRGFISDQKTVVAVGAYIGYLASQPSGLEGFRLDLTQMAERMGATANYIGHYLPGPHTVDVTYLTPIQSTYTLRPLSFPVYLGCKQLNTPSYESRPLYALCLKPGASVDVGITVMLSRTFQDDKEKVEIEDAYDRDGRSIKDKLYLQQQSLVNAESGRGCSWLDDGIFKFLQQ